MRNKTVLLGKDYEALNLLIPLHHKAKEPYILDCTFNSGKMWKKCHYKPDIKTDISKEFKVDMVCDFRSMPFSDSSFDIIIWDPPHLPSNAASKNSSNIWIKTYGITNSLDRIGDNVSCLFLPFLNEAKRLLKHNGIIIAKIADLIHNHKYQWQMCDFINSVKLVGLTPCDMLIKADPCAGNLTSSKWKNIKHLRKSHCYFIVVRNGKCEC